jgi:hypothetical protein
MFDESEAQVLRTGFVHPRMPARVLFLQNQCECRSSISARSSAFFARP